MNLGQMLGATTLLLAVAATPVMADNGRGNKNHHGERGHASHCPPGLAKKSPACVPPGQARHHRNRDNDRDRDHVRYGNGIGEVLRVGDYTIIRDTDRYGFEDRDNWRYYRDGDRAYRVDTNTNKVLAVLNLIQAFSN